MSAAASSSSSSSEQKKKELEDLVLNYLAEHDTINDSIAWLSSVGNNGWDHDTLESVVRSLASVEYVTFTATDLLSYRPTAEGAAYLAAGSPEFRLWAALAATPLPKEPLEAQLGAAFQIGQTNAMKNKWIVYDKEKKVFTRKADSGIVDIVQQQLRTVADGAASSSLSASDLDALKKRKLLAEHTNKTLKVAKNAARFQRQRKQMATELTADLLRSGRWREEQFKDYNFEALGPDVKVGTLHPLLKVRTEFRAILLSMGFSEMPTNRYVESSFWNFDALFQPQQHPSRDSHDTFFTATPRKAHLERVDPAYIQRVKDVHEKGGYDSIGYRYDWKIEEAEKNILRTHTTAISTRMLYNLAQETLKTGKFHPVRYFSIDRVFRNETLDATHLAEFHQVEGLVADRNLTLADLIGTIQTFFHRIGITKMRFKPAFNPYTEPSMEIFGYSNELGKWIEIGNSGIFRAEMLRPMGLPDDVRVIAWGLSLERPTMIKYGIKNIRDLFGYKVKLNIIERNGIARFDQYNPPV